MSSDLLKIVRFNRIQYIDITSVSQYCASRTTIVRKSIQCTIIPHRYLLSIAGVSTHIDKNCKRYGYLKITLINSLLAIVANCIKHTRDPASTYMNTTSENVIRKCFCTLENIATYTQNRCELSDSVSTHVNRLTAYIKDPSN